MWWGLWQTSLNFKTRYSQLWRKRPFIGRYSRSDYRTWLFAFLKSVTLITRNGRNFMERDEEPNSLKLMASGYSCETAEAKFCGYAYAVTRYRQRKRERHVGIAVLDKNHKISEMPEWRINCVRSSFSRIPALLFFPDFRTSNKYTWNIFNDKYWWNRNIFVVKIVF